MSANMSRSMTYWFRYEFRGLPHNPYEKKKRGPELREGEKKKGEGTKLLKSYIDEQMHCHRGKLVERWTRRLQGGSRIASAHAADFRVSEITWGETKMWCQLLKESYHCYWILSLVWLAIALHLLLTTSFSIHGSFTNSTGLVTSTKMETTRLAGSLVVANKVISVLC